MFHFGVGPARSSWRRPSGRLAADVSSDRCGSTLAPGNGLLNAFGHHPIAGIEPGFDDPQLPLALVRS